MLTNIIYYATMKLDGDKRWCRTLFAVYEKQNSKHQFDKDEYAKIIGKINALADEDEEKKVIKKIVFNSERGLYNGFAERSLNKLKNVLLFFINKCGGVFKTKTTNFCSTPIFMRTRHTVLQSPDYRTRQSNSDPSQTIGTRCTVCLMR